MITVPSELWWGHHGALWTPRAGTVSPARGEHTRGAKGRDMMDEQARPAEEELPSASVEGKAWAVSLETGRELWLGPDQWGLVGRKRINLLHQ